MLSAFNTQIATTMLGCLSIMAGVASITLCFLNRWMFRNVYKAIEIDSILISDTVTRRLPPKVIRRPKMVSWEIFGLALIIIGITLIAC